MDRADQNRRQITKQQETPWENNFPLTLNVNIKIPFREKIAMILFIIPP